MTPGRFLLLLVVFVVVLAGLSLVFLKKAQDHPANPTNSWVSDLRNRLLPDSHLKLETDFRSSCRQDRQLLVPAVPGFCQATITTNRSQPVRELKLTVVGASFDVDYEPVRHDSDFADRGATSEKGTLKPDKPVKLVFLPSGGTLKLTRASGAGLSSIKLE
jgi:hypothetical protein